MAHERESHGKKRLSFMEKGSWNKSLVLPLGKCKSKHNELLPHTWRMDRPIAIVLVEVWRKKEHGSLMMGIGTNNCSFHRRSL